MLVKDFMATNPVTLLPETTHRQANEIMKEHNVAHLPVVDKHGKLVGIVVEEDMYRSEPTPATTLSIYEIHSLLSKLQIKEIMTHPVYTVAGECSLEEAARIMLQQNIGCLPVMKGDKLIGIITDTDIFEAFVSMLGGGQEGARFTVRAVDRPGVLAKIAQTVADAGGNIVSVVTWESKNEQIPYITIKEKGADLEQLNQALDALDDKVLDMQTKPIDMQQHG
ncbi:MAG: CBS domain-containing protein [Anaerolineae bacterium]|nr:CBS domain-containing protein [Anaerolineae bacterium]